MEDSVMVFEVRLTLLGVLAVDVTSSYYATFQALARNDGRFCDVQLHNMTALYQVSDCLNSISVAFIFTSFPGIWNEQFASVNSLL